MPLYVASAGHLKDFPGARVFWQDFPRACLDIVDADGRRHDGKFVYACCTETGRVWRFLEGPDGRVLRHHVDPVRYQEVLPPPLRIVVRDAPADVPIVLDRPRPSVKEMLPSPLVTKGFELVLPPKKYYR